MLSCHAGTDRHTIVCMDPLVLCGCVHHRRCHFLQRRLNHAYER
jgi:hypothetical protein